MKHFSTSTPMFFNPRLHPRAWLLACGCLILTYIVATLTGGFTLSPAKRLTSQKDLLNGVFNATLGFQKILVIGLPSRTDRRDSMSLAAAFSGLQVEYIDGVSGVDNKTLPPGGVERGIDEGSLFAWRAHMNALRLIVEQNLTSALVLEDDIDWDIRIKAQMKEFARAARLLVQPLPHTRDQYLDPTYPSPSADQGYQNFDVNEHATSDPTDSPYGDISRWDLLWLGHCGCRFPLASDLNVPLGRAVIANDDTVPEHQHLDMEYGHDELLRQYPPHTRVVSRARVNTCSLAYAISQPGARRFLYELGVHKMSDPNDIMFRYVCDGVDGRQLATCLTVQPQLIQHHRPVGAKAGFSDIADHGDGFNDRAFTRNVRWSVRLNFANLVSGSANYTDSFPDGGEKVHFTGG